MAEADRLPRLPGETEAEWWQRQRAHNLKRAQDQRKRSRVLRAAIKHGVVDDLALLRGETPWEPVVGKWRLDSLLRTFRGIGATRAEDILDMVHLRHHTRVGTLSREDRAELAHLVDEARHPHRGV